MNSNGYNFVGHIGVDFSFLQVQVPPYFPLVCYSLFHAIPCRARHAVPYLEAMTVPPGPTKSRLELSGTVRSSADALWISRQWNQCEISTKLAMRCYVLQFIVV